MKVSQGKYCTPMWEYCTVNMYVEEENFIGISEKPDGASTAPEAKVIVSFVHLVRSHWIKCFTVYVCNVDVCMWITN